MKKITLSLLTLLLVFSTLNAQQEKGITGYDNWLDTWTEFKPNQAVYGKPTQIISGNIDKDTKLFKKDIYLLIGDVFVTNNAILTIEPGTVIIGDFKTKGSLTISKNSQIIAEGTPTDPIVFTSSRSDKKEGDWGGLFILGDAPINTFGNETSLNFGLKPNSTSDISFGGDNPNSNSGILKYVRIEFAGKKTRDFGNFNGLTLAGVGRDTTIYNVMVSYCEGDSFNIMGGDLILVKLISFRSSQNDYQFNYGAQCNILNSLAVRSPYISSPDGSKVLSIKSYDQEENMNIAKKESRVFAENLTMVNISNDLESDIKIGLVQEAIYIGVDTHFTISNSVISGFSPAVILDEKIMINAQNLEKINFNKTYFNNCNGNIFSKYNSNNEDLESWYGSRAFDNVYSKGPDSETFIDASNSRQPDFRLRINRIIASNDYEDYDDPDED
ncbi:hypothetical protein [Winogradskyella ursingii]|uniref:hypothetical protein n=1 Tax=Winogradskyella ursingii TaxID=2686079 RepID=UPI0015CBA1FC|nr:hypothetical protein [Winogradskyella ursingii]